MGQKAAWLSATPRYVGIARLGTDMGGRWAARCQKEGGLRRGAWTAEEDRKLVAFIEKNRGHGSWRTLPRLAGLQRCGKSCRLRWINYLRPDIKRGHFSPEEERTITQMHALLGNKWSAIAAHMPGRTDNEVKNHWNTHLKKRLASMGLDPVTHRPVLLQAATAPFSAQPSAAGQSRPLLSLLDKSFVSHMAQWELARLEAEARLSSSSSSSPQVSPTWPASLKPNPSITLSPDSQQRHTVDSNSSSISPAVRPVELCAAKSATNSSRTVHLKGISNWCAASKSAISSPLSFFDECIGCSGQSCCSNTLKPRFLQEEAGDVDEPLPAESDGMGSAGSVDSSATTMAPLPFGSLQLDATGSCPSYLEDILPTSPDQPCLSGSTSLWTQYLLDYAGLLAMLPPSCSAC